MKKIYMKPEAYIEAMEIEEFMSLSLGGTANDSDALDREVDWDDWDEE